MGGRIGVLGTIEARTDDGEPISMPRSGQRRLIALLASRAGRVASSEWLMEELDLKPGALRTAIGRLRSTLGEDLIRTQAPGYVLDEAEVDASQFEAAIAVAADQTDPTEAIARLAGALDLWRGDAFEEFDTEPWAQAEAARLAELRLGAEESLVRHHIEAGGLTEAIALATSLTGRHPYRDGPTMLLMEALDRAGRRTDALRAYQAHRQGLVDDIGTEPSTELTALESTIATGASSSPAHAQPTSTELPDGTATLLLTDIENSTGLWLHDPAAMTIAVDRTYAILDEAIVAHGGVRPQEQGEGDSVVASFHRSSDAVAAAVDAQLRLATEPWPQQTPIRVRMGLHAGEVQLRGETNYVGPTIIRAARTRNLAAGGQVLATDRVVDLASALPEGVAFTSLGAHAMKGITEPIELFQLTHPDLPSEFPALARIERSNLPTRLASFVGRIREWDELSRLVADHRLVTMTGSGGAGKTSLAHRLAGELPERTIESVWWFELAPLRDEDEVLRSMIDTLEARAAVNESPIDAIVRRLGNDETFVVLDNCEHVIDVAASLCRELIARCPNVRILATSRVALGLPGEVAWRLPSMATGVGDDAVALFLERAAAVGFHPDEADHEVVAHICRQLDGIPLAIELAAARMRVLSPTEALDGLADALRLLRTDGAGMAERQRTIKASIDWSIALLDRGLAELLARLSVFRDGFDLDAVMAVTGDRPRLDVVDDLERLLDHSLIRPAASDDGGRRFTLLETIRQHGAQALVDTFHDVEVASAHARHFASLAVEHGALVETAEEDTAVARLDSELANIRVAFGWLREHEPASFVRAVAGVAPYWTMAGTSPEGIAWLNEALAVLDDDTRAMEGRLVAVRAHMLGNTGDLKSAIPECRRAIELGRSSGDDWAVGRGLWRLSDGISYGSLSTWRPVAEEAEAACVASGDRFARAYMAVWLGVPYLQRGHNREGAEALARSIEPVRASGNPTVAASLRAWLAWTAYYEGRFEDSLTLAEETLAGEGFRLPLQRVFVERLRSGASLYLGRPDPAPDFPDLARQFARRGEMMASMIAADWEPRRRLLIDPETTFDAAEHVLERHQMGMAVLTANTSLCWAAVSRGDLDLARRYLAAAEATGTPTRWPLHQIQLLQLQAATNLDRDPAEAQLQAAAAVELAAEEGHEIHRSEALRVLAVAADLADDTEAAQQARTEAARSRARSGATDAFVPVRELEARYA